MVLWNEIDTSLIEVVPLGKDRTKFRYEDGPLRFQVPRGMCTWGVSAYKSLQVDVVHTEFIQWWKELESQLCPLEPFNSNLKNGQLRIKIDESVYIFGTNSKQVSPDIKEGLFRGQEISCLIDVDSTYYYNGNWGLTVRLYQVKTLSDAPQTECDEGSVLQKGVCAFLSDD
jgi:hypothetical protein